MSSPAAQIVARAESLPGVKAGIARLDDLLHAPSYRAIPQGAWSSSVSDEGVVIDWSSDASSVLVLGLHHPEDEPRLDWWDDAHSPGDRRLSAICESLRRWLQDEQAIGADLLPYHAERGGVFLKDAAALAGLGVIGRNNLLINPVWGPRIRFRAVLLEGDMEPTGPLEEFSPCASCPAWCHLTCPQSAFSSGTYHRPSCAEQMDADVASRAPAGEGGVDRRARSVIKYCRACELACPVGT